MKRLFKFIIVMLIAVSLFAAKPVRPASLQRDTAPYRFNKGIQEFLKPVVFNDAAWVDQVYATGLRIGQDSTYSDFVVDSLGRVGIGTTTPSAKLHIYNTGGFPNTPILERAGLTTQDAWSGMRLLATKTTDMTDGFGSTMNFSIQDNEGVINSVAAIGAVRAGEDNTGDIIFKPAISGVLLEKMRITSDGNVGIGTTSPVRLLELYNQLPLLRFNQNDTYSWDIGQDDGTYSDNNDFIIRDNFTGNVPFVIDTNGYVGLGTDDPKATVSIKPTSGVVNVNAYEVGTMNFSYNSGSGTYSPTITGKSSGIYSGLYFIGATNNNTANTDMTFNIREDNNTDYSNFTTGGFTFSRYTTDLMHLSRSGILTLLNGTGINEFSTDSTFADNSNDAVPTERAVRNLFEAYKGFASMLDNTDTTAIATAGTIYPVRGTFVNDLDGWYYLDADPDWPGIVVDSTLIDSIYLDLRLDGHASFSTATTEARMGFRIERADGTTVIYNVRPSFAKYADEIEPFVFQGYPLVGAKDKITIVMTADKTTVATVGDIVASVKLYRYR